MPPKQFPLRQKETLMVNRLTDEDLFILTLPFDYSYYYKLRKSLEEGAECAFCSLDPEINPILYENQHWAVTKNAFPNKRSCSVMLLIISKSHWRQLIEITPDAWDSFSEIVRWVEGRFDLPGGMLFLRFGDISFNNGTIRHLHWNLWVPDKTGKVFAPIFKSEDEQRVDFARAKEFSRRYEAGEVPA